MTAQDDPTELTRKEDHAAALGKTKNDIAPKEKREPPRASFHFLEGNVLKIEVSGDCENILRAAGNFSVMDGMLNHIARLGSQGQGTDEDATNFALGFVDAMQPQDAAEVLLTTQMAAIHQATMMMARRLNHVENIPQQDAAERALNKLTRSFTAQMDTLKRYRSKGQQTVRVERVTVEDGGRAVVGSVTHGGGGDYES